MTATEFPVQLSIKREMQGVMWNFRGDDVATVMGHYNEARSFHSTLEGGIKEMEAVENLSQSFEVEPAEDMSIFDPRNPGNQRPAPAPTSPPRQKAPEDMQIGEKYPCPVNTRAVHERRTGNKGGNRWDGVLCTNKPSCAAVWL